MARSGQVWSTDFTMSLVIFAVAATIAFTIITNTFEERSYEAIREQSVDAAALLATEGYPAHWGSGDVIRAGLLSDNALSMRKAAAFAQTDPARMRSALRITDNMYIYATTGDGAVAPIWGACGMGDLAVPVTARNRTLPTLAISDGDPVAMGLASLGIAMAADDAAYYNLTHNDVVIIEGGSDPAISDAEAVRAIDDAAQRGMTFIVIGDPLIPILGIDVNSTTAGSIQVVTGGGQLGLADGETLTVSGTIPAINAPAGVSNYREIATIDGRAAYATWTYGDAAVWYLATAQGQHSDGRDLQTTIINATRSMIEVPWPECGDVTLPDADQVAVHTRTIVHHDELLLMHVLVWRD